MTIMILCLHTFYYSNTSYSYHLQDLTLIIKLLVLLKCSGYQCGVHADIRWGSFMPIHMLKEVGSWSVTGGLWLSWLRSCPNEGEAILDHQELMGWELGREWILQNLQGPQYLWSGLHGLNCRCGPHHLTVGHEF